MSRFPIRAASRATIFAAALLLPVALHAQSSNVAEQIEADKALLATEKYVTPPAAILDLVTAPRQDHVAFTMQSPDRTHFLQLETARMPSVQEFGKFHDYFGGLQVDPAANRARTLTTRAASGLAILDGTTGAHVSVQVPAGATVSSPVWSPDGKQVAYIANFSNGSYVYVADAVTGKSTRASTSALLATLVTTVHWTADGSGIVAVFVPSPRAPEPKAPDIATGPTVRLWLNGVKEPERNFASLLDGPYDKALMKYFVTGQLGVVNVKTHALRKVGAPAMISDVNVSPDGNYFRVTTMQEPFSYVVQYNSFGHTESLWDATGKVLAQIDSQPSREGQKPDTTRGFGRGGNSSYRDLDWMPQGAGLYYLTSAAARDTTDSASAAGANGRGARGGGGARRDEVVQWLPPFGKNDTTVLYRAPSSISNVVFSDDAKTLFVATSTGTTGEIYAVKLADPETRQVVIRQRDYTPSFAGAGRGGRGFGGRGGADSAAFYNNPGAMMTTLGSRGGRVAMVSADGNHVFFTGTQYHPDYLANAPQAFVDQYPIGGGDKSRIFLGATDASESVVTSLDNDFSRAIVTRETPAEVGQSYLWTRATGQRVKLTNNQDYEPGFTAAIRKRIVVTRPDGFQFVVNLTLPANYAAGTRLPAMFWFYPAEFTSQAEYDQQQRTENVNAFPTRGPRTIEYLVTQGYAVANFGPPIVGPAGRMNDFYVHDLVADLSAVIDTLDAAGYIDRTRLGIGGHSYGAFSTMNALAHTPFFKAGIAGDGMYNRTLTPNDFQNERRDFWEAQKTYEEMSPFFYADKIQGAVLMYHSIEDQNVGTDPISSIRMLQALRAYGKPSALFMYPYEDHGPATSESDLDQWARWVAWLDMYVKHAGEWRMGDDSIVMVRPPAAHR